MIERSVLSPLTVKLSTSLPKAASKKTQLGPVLSNAQNHPLIQSAKHVLWLPNSFHSFLFYLAGLLLLTGLLLLHIWLSAQTWKDEIYLGAVQRQYDEVEQLNADLTWKIAQHASLQPVQERALAIGFQPAAPDRHYVFVSEDEAAVELVAPVAPVSMASVELNEPSSFGWANQVRVLAADLNGEMRGLFGMQN